MKKIEKRPCDTHVGVFIQSPYDDWDFYSFSIRAIPKSGVYSFRSLAVCSDPYILELCRSLDPIPKSWDTTYTPMVIVPLAILRRQVDQTSQRLASLIHQVEEVESAVAADSQTVDFGPLVKRLHVCNAELIKLERRWYFQDQLAIFVQELMKKTDRVWGDLILYGYYSRSIRAT